MAPQTQDQVYAINSNELIYTHPEFTVDPDFCPVEYAYSETNFVDFFDNEQTAISRSGRDYSIEWDRDLSPVGQTQTATIIATTKSIYGPVQGMLMSMATWDLTFTNSCTDENAVTIIATSQTNPDPDTYSDTPVIFNYNPFTITADPGCQTGVEAVKCRSVSPDLGSILPCQELDQNGQLTWQFSEDDFTSGRVPPGTYTFTYDVSTSAGYEVGVTKSFTVEVELIDPCENPSITPVDLSNV